MFLLQENPIDPAKAREHCCNNANGALASFEGIVRGDKHNNTHVSALLYVADVPACVEEGEKIIKEALGLFALNDAVCIQRTGKVNAGEIAVWIGAWSGHRDEAFKGCRYIIEEIKRRLLVWKKEFYADGTSAWIHGAQTPVIS